MTTTMQATLEYLTAPYYQNVMNARKKNKETLNDPDTDSSISKDDLHFYRKRIVALTKDMLKGIEAPAPNKDIKSHHDAYVRHMIQYFRMIDRKDILQDQYSSVASEAALEGANEEAANEEVAAEEFISLEKANKLMMQKKTIKIANLDDFVIIQNNDLDELNEKDEKRRIPIKKEIDLKTPNLKTKGIKKKKKDT
jgi:hypothetical protein